MKEIRERWLGDPPYHPEDMPDKYLSSALIEELFNEIGSTDNNDVLEVIQKHEMIHKDFVMGQILREDRDRAVKLLYDAYVSRHRNWPHQEEAYVRFYSILNNGNWL